VGDGTRTYVELEVDASPSGRSGLTMLFPEDELLLHVREVVPRAVAEAALAAMTDAEPSPLDGASSWRVRVARTESSVEDGDLVELARVLRDLAAHDAGPGLSSSERRAFDGVRDLVVGELVGALGWSVEEAIDAVDDRLTGSPGVGTA
jgi:RNA polymerase-interacting CarD/CdnL/TRCF family regulator